MMKLRGGILALLVCVISPAAGQTGTPGLDPFDQMMKDLMTKYPIPGGTVAVTRNGRLMMARGYGYVDAAKTTPVQADSRFRIASLSKAITAVTIMHLVEQGKLSLDQKAFALLPDLPVPPGKSEDPRLASITIRHLLTHSGGWDDSSKGSGFDPMFNSETITSSLGVPAPASTENIIRYMRGEVLQFTPGDHYVYSNFGYAVLGRIIERVTGVSYEEYVRINVLAPMGITEMRMGQTLPQGRLPGEVAYDSPLKTLTVFPDVTPKSVFWPYGGWYMESMDAHGGWVATAINYAKFVNAIDGRRGKAFLQESSIAAMTARPAIPDWAGQSAWYAFGLMVRPDGSGQNWWHSGSLDGTTTYHVRTASGFEWVVFLNWRPETQQRNDTLQSDIDAGLWNASAKVSAWPTTDYFANYPDRDASGKPALTTREGVVNAATFDRGVVSGSWISLFGVKLAASTREWGAADFSGGALPTSLDGVQVNIDGRPAAVAYISPTQINVQAPAGLQPGWVTAEVINNGVSTGYVLTHAVEHAPGAFTYVSGQTRFAVATKPDGSLVSPQSPATAAKAGDVISVYASGLASSAAGVLIGAAVDVPGVAVTIGDQPAAVQFAGLISPGLFQINVVVPVVPAGDQRLVITVGGASSPKDVFLPVGVR